MGFFDLVFRDQMQSKLPETSKAAFLDELEGQVSRISAWASVEHNDDGTHNPGPTYGFVPVGGMIKWGLTTAPTSWLLCDGTDISRTAYPVLFQVIGINYGAGDGTTTFTLPVEVDFIILAE